MTDITDADILKERAAELAKPDDHYDMSDAGHRTTNECLVVSIQPNQYAFRLTDVTEVLRLDQLTFVPGYPAYIAGIFPYRGMVLTAIDFRKYLGVPSPGITQLDRVVVVHEGTRLFGILIDRVEGVETMDLAMLQPEVAGLAGDLQGMMIGVAAEGYPVLDVTKIFAEPRLAAMSHSSNSSSASKA